MLIGSAQLTGIIRGATLIGESGVDKTKLAIYSKLTGNPADPLNNLGEGGTYRYKLGGVEKKQDIINLPNYKDYLLKIEDFWKLMGAAGWNWDKIGDKERYQDIYNAYLEVNKQ